MPLQSITLCPVCNGTNLHPFIQCIDYTTSGETFQIKNCSACGLLITTPRPDTKSLGSYYESENYISHTNQSNNFVNAIYKLVRTFTIRWKINLVSRYKKNGTILDFGCGTGEFLLASKKANWNCVGIEPSTSGRMKAIQLTSAPIFETLDHLKEQRFDIITLWHVLEHIPDLNPVIQQLKQHLAPKGILVIAVPNHKSMDAQHYQSHWAGYDVPRHLWHFSQQSIHKLLSTNNLKLTETIPMRQDSFYVSVLSEKYRQPDLNPVIAFARAFIVGLRSNMAARQNKNYSSLVYIATT